MLNPAEKAYFFALQSLKRKDYRRAAEFFDQAAPFFSENQEFTLLRETTSLLVAVREELQELEAGNNAERIVIEEYF
jgi:hypothetical protein